ncbi:MAG: OmpH family outer membrane protein [Pseudomonadota bacterium]
MAGAWFWHRRCILALGAACSLWPAASLSQDQVFVISRERVATEVHAAQQLRRAEAEMTAVLQAQIERAKEALSAEENDLARNRADIEQEEFERRAASFDRRVRQTRRIANERGAELQKGFQEARAIISNAIPELLEQVRIEAGARVILDADQVIIYDPALDLTDRLIEIFNQAMPAARVPDIDLSEPVLAPDIPLTEDDPGDNQ